MSTITVNIGSAAAVLAEEGHRIAGLGPVITREQLAASITSMRLALAQLEHNCHKLPAEHPAHPVADSSGKGAWP